MKKKVSRNISVVKDSITSILQGFEETNQKSVSAMDSISKQFFDWTMTSVVTEDDGIITMGSSGGEKTLAEHAAECTAKKPETCPYVKKMAEANIKNGMDKEKAWENAVSQHTQAVAQAQSAKTGQQTQPQPQQQQETVATQPQPSSGPQYDPDTGERISMTLPEPLTIETDFGPIVVDTDVKKETVEKLIKSYQEGNVKAEEALNQLSELTENKGQEGAETKSEETPTESVPEEATSESTESKQEEAEEGTKIKELQDYLYKYRDYVLGLQKQSQDAYDAGDIEKSESLFKQAEDAARTYNDVYHDWKELVKDRGGDIGTEKKEESAPTSEVEAETSSSESTGKETSPSDETTEETVSTEETDKKTEPSPRESDKDSETEVKEEEKKTESTEVVEKPKGARRWDESPTDSEFATGKPNEYKVGDVTYVDVSKMSPIRAMFNSFLAGFTGKGIITKFDRIFGGWEQTKNAVSKTRNTLRDGIIGSTVLGEINSRIDSMEDGIAKEALGDIRDMLENAKTPEKKLAARKKYLAWQKEFGSKGIGNLEDDDENHKNGGVSSSGMPQIRDVNTDGLGGTDRNGILSNKTDILDKIKKDFRNNGFDFDEGDIKELSTPSSTRFDISLGEERPSDASIKKLIEDIEFKLPIGEKSQRSITYNKGNGTIRISIENDKKGSLGFSTLAKSEDWKARRNDGTGAFFLGINQEDGSPIIASLDQVVHMLIAGATGSGKSARIDSLICSLMDGSAPEDLQFTMIDPKKVTFPKYKNNPYVKDVITDMDKAASRFNWAVNEMENRYSLLEKAGVEDIKSYNELAKQGKLPAGMPQHLGRHVIVVDELSNLMKSHGGEIEASIEKLGEKARAAGIHLVLATQRPDVKSIPGSIKANIPTKVGLTTSNETDSRVIGINGLSKIPAKGPFVISGNGFNDVAGDGVYIDGKTEVPQLMKRINDAYRSGTSGSSSSTKETSASSESSSVAEPKETSETSASSTTESSSSTETSSGTSTPTETPSLEPKEAATTGTEETSTETTSETAEKPSAEKAPRYDMRTREGRLARLNARYDARLKELEDSLNSGDIDDDEFDEAEEELDKWRKSQETAIDRKFPQNETATPTVGEPLKTGGEAGDTEKQSAEINTPEGSQQAGHKSPFDSIDTPEARIARADKKAEIAIKAAEREFKKNGDQRAYETAIATAKAEYEQEVDDIRNNRSSEEIAQREERKRREKAESDERLRKSVVTERKGKPIPGATPNSYRGNPENLTPLSSKEVGTIQSALKSEGLDGWKIDKSQDHGDRPVKDASGKTYVRHPTNGSYGFVKDGQFHYVVNTTHPDYYGENSTHTQELKKRWKDNEDYVLSKKEEIGKLSKAGPLYAQKLSELRKELADAQRGVDELYKQYRHSAFGTDEMPEVEEEEPSIKSMVLDALSKAIAFG